MALRGHLLIFALAGWYRDIETALLLGVRTRWVRALFSSRSRETAHGFSNSDMLANISRKIALTHITLAALFIASGIVATLAIGYERIRPSPATTKLLWFLWVIVLAGEVIALVGGGIFIRSYAVDSLANKANLRRWRTRRAIGLDGHRGLRFASPCPPSGSWDCATCQDINTLPRRMNYLTLPR